MTYSIHYHIISISYFEKTRVTNVAIVNESTGEVFSGEARRHPDDKMDVRLGINLATLRAVRKAMLRDLADDKTCILYDSSCHDFKC